MRFSRQVGIARRWTPVGAISRRTRCELAVCRRRRGFAAYPAEVRRRYGMTLYRSAPTPRRHRRVSVRVVSVLGVKQVVKVRMLAGTAEVAALEATVRRDRSAETPCRPNRSGFALMRGSPLTRGVCRGRSPRRWVAERRRCRSGRPMVGSRVCASWRRRGIWCCWAPARSGRPTWCVGTVSGFCMPPLRHPKRRRPIRSTGSSG
jgi:hypothetical protein